MTMTDQKRLNTRVRWIRLCWILLVGCSLAAAFALPAHRSVTEGLLVGEVGGAYVVYSMIRQGHRNDTVKGSALFASGIVGMFTRLIVLATVLLAAIKLHVSAVSSLGGYLMGYVFLFSGLAGYLRNPGENGEESR